MTEYIKTRKRFTLETVIMATGIDRKPVMKFLNQLCREGYLIDESATKRKEGKTYQFINPMYCSLKDLSLRVPKRPENSRDKIWRTLRYLRKATQSDLVRLTGCTPMQAKNYIKVLANHRYIRAIGKQGRENIWLLLNDTGPKRPQIKEKIESIPEIDPCMKSKKENMRITATAFEIAQVLKCSKRTILRRAEEEKWPFEIGPNKAKRFIVQCLPIDISSGCNN